MIRTNYHQTTHNIGSSKKLSVSVDRKKTHKLKSVKRSSNFGNFITSPQTPPTQPKTQFKLNERFRNFFDLISPRKFQYVSFSCENQFLWEKVVAEHFHQLCLQSFPVADKTVQLWKTKFLTLTASLWKVEQFSSSNFIFPISRVGKETRNLILIVHAIIVQFQRVNLFWCDAFNIFLLENNNCSIEMFARAVRGVSSG